MCAQLPVELQMVVLHQFAQDVQELIKADLVVLVFVSRPEQLRDVVWLPAALRNTKRINTTEHPVHLSSRHLLLLEMERSQQHRPPVQEAFRKPALTQNVSDEITTCYKIRL